MVLLCVCGQAAPSSKPTEYQVKAAFLFNFAKFVEWPPQSFRRADGPLCIGILGEDPFGPVLDKTVQNKTVNGHALTLRRLKRGQDPTGCHVLFISRSEQGQAAELIAQLKGQSVLLVSEIDDFLEAGGMIRLYLETDSVKFAINPGAVEQAGLSASSKLLAIAKIERPPSTR
jgi:hypothetical protein